ncbi:IPT/TIG domain-containing protein [Streptomyces inhibens]|uniref:IPT/TIG domain-containing protein n=1 Tax=Streptomyces inhibens TaxID=2293571 RepID=UPI00402A8CE3
MGVAPQLGPLANGDAVKVTGIGLSDATDVRFGTVCAGHFTAGSDTRIEFTVPAGSAGNTPVTVTTAGGTGDAVSYAYLLSVIAVTPGGSSPAMTCTRALPPHL